MSRTTMQFILALILFLTTGTLVRAQAPCLTAGDCTAAVPVPNELLTQPTGSATLVATPVALIDPGYSGSGAFAAADGSWQMTWDEGT